MVLATVPAEVWASSDDHPARHSGRCFRCRGNSQALWSLALGQTVSVLVAGTGIFSALLATEGVDIPVVQSSLNYFLLSLHLLWCAPRIAREGLAFSTWRYGLWALADVEANFLVVWAFQYTSVASVALLDCFTIPCAMLLSRVILSARFSRGHVLASAICVVGLSLTVLSDLRSEQASQSPSGPAWFGDLMVLAGASLYGLSNVLQELLLKGGGRRCETLGMLGLWGSLISCVQAAILEREALERCSWSPTTIFYLLGFQLCLFAMYVLTSIFLGSADATLFNLSLLTSDVYSVLFAWLVQHRQLTWLYGAAFASTVCGLVIYHLQPPVTAEPSAAASSCVNADGLLDRAELDLS